ncbi:hypothetical protein P70_0079 [Listeria phage P70]|uniref:Uncharacterized protein n=1 Tax=Listeria phage P70 TaxID=1225800 RepID=J9QIY7_9CAUD|nr:hypothetical protein P70_0079 [Listeria phage P70]AFQ96268.1 hypothetical protein P70_0079 [Listeria phage P70]
MIIFDDEILIHINRFESFEEYASYNTDCTRKEFDERLEFGLLQDISPSSYNGASDTTQFHELTNSNIIGAIHAELQECRNYYTDMLYPDEELSDREIILEMVTELNIFTLEGHLYIDLD